MAGHAPPPLGPYQYHEVLSALRKDVKLGNVEDAIYWATVIRENLEWKTAHRTIAKQLWISAAEDIDDPAIVLRAFAVYQMADKVPETEHLMYLIAAMCKARKYWEHEEGRAVDRMVLKAIGDCKHPARNRPIPPYALDRHTRRGWAIFKQTGQFDDRFSGTYLGRAKTVYLWLRDRVLGPGTIDTRPDGSPDPDGFTEFWGEQRALLAQTGDEIEPNDPFKAERRLTYSVHDGVSHRLDSEQVELFEEEAIAEPDETYERPVGDEEKAWVGPHNWTNT